MIDYKYDVSTASNAKQGIEKLESFAPDVLLLDWNLPDTPGIDVITTIRDTMKKDDLYIIMISGKIMTENIVSAIFAGADDYVIKPFSPDELLVRIHSGIRNRQRRIFDLENNDKFLKGLHKIELIVHQLSKMAGKDKRVATMESNIKHITEELKSILHPKEK